MNIVLVTIVTILVFFVKESVQSLLDDINNSSRIGKILSRKRRYLTFPTGSSLQLVYCLTMPSIGMGQIFTFGSTAALAWELPTEADKLLETFGKRRTTTTTTAAPTEHPVHDKHTFEDYPSEKIDRPPSYGSGTLQNNKMSGIKYPAQSYYNPLYLNKYSENEYTPTWSSRPEHNYVQDSLDSFKDTKGYLNGNRYRTYDQKLLKIEPESASVHPVYHEIHRRTRRDLYKKIENLFTALSRDGRSCLLKSICEVSKVAERKGSFMEEILKAIFRIKPHANYHNEDDYDNAADKNIDCVDEYPSCEYSLWTNMF